MFWRVAVDRQISCNLVQLSRNARQPVVQIQCSEYHAWCHVSSDTFLCSTLFYFSPVPNTKHHARGHTVLCHARGPRSSMLWWRYTCERSSSGTSCKESFPVQHVWNLSPVFRGQESRILQCICKIVHNLSYQNWKWNMTHRVNSKTIRWSVTSYCSYESETIGWSVTSYFS